MDDELLEQQQKAYAVQGVDESEPAMPPKKKRKGDNTENVSANEPVRAQTERQGFGSNGISDGRCYYGSTDKPYDRTMATQNKPSTLKSARTKQST